MKTITKERHADAPTQASGRAYAVWPKWVVREDGELLGAFDSYRDAEALLTPKPGMGVTYQIGGDSYPGTIVRVSASGKTFWWVRDRAIYSGPKVGAQGAYNPSHFVFELETGSKEQRAHKDKWGTWRASKSCGHLYLGFREHYQDPSF